LKQAIDSYRQRVRRFGQTDEQVMGNTANNPANFPASKIS
jgi:hypothetical protein